MLFHFYINISVTLNDNETLFYPYLVFTEVIRNIKVGILLAFDMLFVVTVVNVF